MTTGLINLTRLILSTATIIWTLCTLYELREAFSDPATQAAARKRLLDDLQHFSHTSRNFYEQGKNALQLLSTTYKLHIDVFVDTVSTFVRDMVGGGRISELIGWPEDHHHNEHTGL